MKVVEIQARPLALENRVPYHYSRGVPLGTNVVLVEVRTDDGIVGYGESTGDRGADAVVALIQHVSQLLIGRSPFDIEALTTGAQRLAKLDNAPRYASHALAGVEMALWDIVGKAVGQPVHRLLGGAVREEIDYFAFLQGGAPEELAEDAKKAVADGYSVIYLKVGLGEARDVRNVAAVREAIGDLRLRIDANEAWDPGMAIRMINKLAEYDLEFVEQPTPARSIRALRQVRESVSVPIAADQCAYTLSETFEVCAMRAADVLVIGPHETGGLLGLRKAAAIAEAAGISVCMHGQQDSGISSCAENQIAATIPNLTDGNQIMHQVLKEDIVAEPDLRVREGTLPVIDGPGLGMELDWDAVERAAERYREEGPFNPF